MNRTSGERGSGVALWCRRWRAGDVRLRWLVLGFLMLVGSGAVLSRRAWLVVMYPRDGVAVAEALGKFSIIQRPPLVDAEGRRLAMIRTTGRGIEVAVEDAEIGRSYRLLEVWDAEYDPGSAHVYGWGAAGESLAFGMTNGVHLADLGESGGVYRLPPRRGLAGVQWMEGRGWLCLDGDGTLWEYRRGHDGWEEGLRWRLPLQGEPARWLRVLGPGRIAWADQVSVWEGDLETGQWNGIWNGEGGQITSVDYEPARELYLITYTFRTNRVTVCQLIAAGGRDRPRVLAEGDSILDGRWLMGGGGWAYRTVRENRPRVVVRVGGMSGPRRVLDEGAVYHLSTAREGGWLFCHASATNEPPGIWRYDVVKDELECVWWPGEPGVRLPALQPVLTSRAPYGAGHWATFDLVPPANYRKGRKYPLVIGLGTYEWTPIAHGVSAQALARAGAYVALVRYRWDQRRPETVYDHTNHVLAVEAVMRAHPSVDGNRVYLFGFSAGTMPVSALVNMYPGRYRGVMLFNPSEMPKPQPGMTRRILATWGEAEAFPTYAERRELEYCQVGIPFEWHVHPMGRHIIRAKESLKERAVWTLDFVFGS